MRAPPWPAITALLCAGAFFAGRQSSGAGGGAGPPQKQPARSSPPIATYSAEPLPSTRVAPPREAPSAEAAALARASSEPPPPLAASAASGAASTSASAPDEAPEAVTSGCAMPFWRRDQFDAARDWTGMADAPSLASADTWLRYDGTATAGHLYSAATKVILTLTLPLTLALALTLPLTLALTLTLTLTLTKGYVNYRSPDNVRGHGDTQPRRAAPQVTP